MQQINAINKQYWIVMAGLMHQGIMNAARKQGNFAILSAYYQPLMWNAGGCRIMLSTLSLVEGVDKIADLLCNEFDGFGDCR